MNLLVPREGLGFLYSIVTWKICLYHNQLPVDTCIIYENKGLNTNYVQYRKHVKLIKSTFTPISIKDSGNAIIPQMKIIVMFD